MRRNLVFLCLLFMVMMVATSCDSDNSGLNFSGGSPNFTLLDANGNPITNTFWAVLGGGFTPMVIPSRSSNPLGFTDGDGDTCPDPSDDAPQTANGDAQQDGCTDENGNVSIICTPGSTVE